MNDRVTITKFSVQESKDTYNKTMFSESDIKDVEAIKKGLAEAAIKAGKKPPEIVLSVILIPDWKKEGNSYKHEDYIALKKVFMEQVKKSYGSKVDVVHDFYDQTSLTWSEKQYLHGLGIPGVGGLGSVADMLKTHSIIDNSDRCHLNIDSNTKIADYDAFYKATFGAEIKDQKLLLNASYYDHRYVSTHNKVVYTPPNVKESSVFRDELIKHCQNNHKNNADKKRNSIYSKAFTKACARLKISTEFKLQEIDTETQKPKIKTCYRANLDNPAYGLTKHVVMAINMSWAPSGSKDSLSKLKQIPAIKVGDATVDFQAIQYIVKKNTQEMCHDCQSDANKLLKMSDTKNDDLILKKFFENTKKADPKNYYELSKMIPDTTKGNVLCQRVFGVDVKTLHQQANKITLEATKKVQVGIGYSSNSSNKTMQITRPKTDIKVKTVSPNIAARMKFFEPKGVPSVKSGPTPKDPKKGNETLNFG